MVDLTKVTKNAQNKVKSISAAQLVGGSTAPLRGGSYVNTTDQYDLFYVPANCLITDTYVNVEEASQAAVTVNIGYSGANELINAGAASAVAVLKDAGIRLPTTTGKLVTAKFSAPPSQGRFFVIVEYIEYTLTNGKLTKQNP